MFKDRQTSLACGIGLGFASLAVVAQLAMIGRHIRDEQVLLSIMSGTLGGAALGFAAYLVLKGLNWPRAE